MDPTAWLKQAQDELAELGDAAASDPADAWRALVLAARLLASPSGLAPPMSLVQQLPLLLDVAGPVDPQGLLDQLAGELEAEIDPWGTLLDALLDLDDAISVLSLAGRERDAAELSRRAAGLASMFPERVSPLGPFAEMRLQTVRDEDLVAAVWRTVELSPALELAEALPPVQRSTSGGVAQVISAQQLSALRVTAFVLPEEAFRAAADSGACETWELQSDQTGVQAWVYLEGGRMKLEVRKTSAGVSSAVLVARRRVDGAALAQCTIRLQVSGSTGYADLGPSAGSENRVHRLISEAGLAPEAITLVLTVAHE